MFRPAMALAVLLSAGPADASSQNWDYHEVELARISAWLRDVELVARINSDPVLRTIVCRVPFSDITPDALYRATKLPPARVMQAVEELKGMGLVAFGINLRGREIITAANNEARKRMRRWSYRWCGTDDRCAVAR